MSNIKNKNEVLLNDEIFNKQWLADFLNVTITDMDEHADNLTNWVTIILFDNSPMWYLGGCEDWGVVVRKNFGGFDAEAEKITFAELFKRLESVGYKRI